MDMFKIKILMVFPALLMFAWEALADSGYVAAKANGVPVLAEPKADSQVLVTLQEGEALEAIERKGMFWQVKVDGKTGYISVLKVQRRTSKDDVSLAKSIRKSLKENRKQDNTADARSRSAVMGVRGLDEGEESGLAGNVKPNMRMVYRMEDRQVTGKEMQVLGDSLQDEIAVKAQ